MQVPSLRVRLPAETRNLGILDSRILGFGLSGTSGSESNLKHDLVSRKVEPGDSTVVTQDYLAFHTSVFDVFIYIFLTCLQIRSNGSICEEVEEEGKKSRHRGKAGGTNQCKSSSRKIYFFLGRRTTRKLRARGAGEIFLVEEDIYSGEDDCPAHGDGPADNITSTNDFPAYLAEGADMAWRKRSQNCFQEGERSRKTSRSIGVGSPPQEGISSQSDEKRMDLARERGPRSSSDALPMGAATQDKQPVAIPQKGKVSPAVSPWQPLQRGK